MEETKNTPTQDSSPQASTPASPASKTGAPLSSININQKFVWGALLVLVIGVAGFLLMPEPALEDDPAAINVDEGETISVELGEGVVGRDRLPAGFPADIPVELEGIVESYARTYPSNDMVQYTVSYHSAESMDVKYEEYDNFMTEASYGFSEDGKDQEHGYLYGTRENDDLSVTVSVISETDAETLVQVTYIDRE